MFFLFFQAEDGIRDLVRSRGLGDVYKRQTVDRQFEHTEGWFGLYYQVPLTAKTASLYNEDLGLSLIHI